MTAGKINHVGLSEDSRIMVITGPDGRQATLRSQRPGGFTADDVRRGHQWEWPSALERGAVNRCWRHNTFGRTWYLHINTGPPTWWLPRVEIGRRADGYRRVMVGWIRGMAALAWKAAENPEPTTEGAQ